MLLRAITLHREPYEFELKDCPIFINDAIIALTNKPGSPLLQGNTIMRGDDESGIYESDFVITKDTCKLIGYVIYTDRFCILNRETHEVIPLDENAQNLYDFSSNLQLADIMEINKFKSFIQFRIGDIIFRINSLIRVIDDRYLYISRKNTNALDLHDLAYCTGLRRNENELCFGDIVSDGVVCLHNFRPSIRLKDGSYRNILEEEYDA